MNLPDARFPHRAVPLFNRRAALAAACVAALAVAGAGWAADAPAASARTSIDEANPLVGTAPLDRPLLLGNAPPPGEPTYSGMTSPGATLPQSATEATPVNLNVDLSYPAGVGMSYYYANPTMIGLA